MGIAIANRKNRCDFGALSPTYNKAKIINKDMAEKCRPLFGAILATFCPTPVHTFALYMGGGPGGVPQEDVNGEKLTVKKWWIFGARFFHGLVPIFSQFTPIFHGL